MPKSQKKPIHNDKSDFGRRLADARRARGLTQAQLADLSGVHVSHVLRTEAGKVQPSVDIVKRLAQALDVSTDELIFDRISEAAVRRMKDQELIAQFAAIESFSEEDKKAIKTVLTAMIVKQRVEAALPGRKPSSDAPANT